MITLYQKDGTTKIGALNDCIECLVEEERNGLFEVSFVYPVSSDLCNYLEEENIIVCNANDTLLNQKFRIYMTRKLMSNRIEVFARHISFDLAYDYVDSIDIENQSCEYALNTIFRNSQFSTHYKGYSDIINTQNYKISKVNCIEAIGGTSGSILDAFGTGAEILRDNTNIHVLNKRGHDNGVSIEYAKNLTGFELEEDYSELITRIIPFATYSDSETNEEILVEANAVDSDYISNYSHPYISYMDFSDKFEDEEIPTTEKLINLAKKYFEDNECDKPKQNFKIEFIPLSKCVGYEGIQDNISLCDTVTIKDTRFNVDTKAKVIKTVFNVLKNKYESMELGEPRTTLGDIINSSGNGEDGKQGPPGPQGPPGADGSIGDFPNSLPSTPVLSANVYGFASIELNWTYENKVYYNYELYGSKIKDFTPNTFDLIHAGQTSSFLFQAKPNETWYFRVCAVNTHGERTPFSDQTTVNTTKVDNLSNYVQNQAINEALIGTLSLDRGWVGTLKGNYIDAKQLSVTNGNGIRTLDIDSYGNVNLNVNSLKISSSSVATETYASNQANTSLSNAKTYADNVGNSTLTSANTHASNVANTAQTNAINTAKDYTNTKITDTKAEIKLTTDSISQRVSSNESTTSTLSTKVTTIEGTANKAQTTANSANTLANTANNTANTNKNNITTLQTTVTTTNNKVAELTTNLDGITQRVASTESTLTTTTNKLNNLHVGGRNILLSSGSAISNNNYGTQSYKVSELFEVGKQYTVTICVTPANKVTHFMPFVSGGYTALTRMSVKGTDKQTVSATFTFEGYHPDKTPPNIEHGNAFVTFYRYPNDNTVTSDSTIHWVKVEKGNKATDWTPAPEDVDSSIANVDSKVQTTNNKVASIETNLNGITQRVSSTESTVSSHTTQLGTVDSRINTAKNSAISTASSDATAKANNALADAKTYTNGQITTVNTTINNKVAEIKATTDAITQRVSSTETITNEMSGTVNNLKSSHGLAYAKDIIIYGDSNKYYPVYIIGGNQNILRTIKIWRNLGEQAPSDWNTSTHKASLVFEWLGNFGGWGGATYSEKILEHTTCYAPTLANCHIDVYSQGYVFYLRGGGTNGAIYHFASDQSLSSLKAYYNGSSDLVWSSGDYKVYANSPLTSINTTRLDGLKIAKESSVTAVDAKVTTTNSKVATLETNLNGITQRVASTESTTAILVTEMDAVDGKINTAKNSAISSAVGVKDTRNDNQNPSWYITNYPQRTVEEFKYSNVIGIGSSSVFGVLTTVVPWGNASGGYPTQTFRSNSTATYTRKGTSTTTWGAWSQLEDTTGSQAKATQALNDAKAYTTTEVSKTNSKVATLETNLSGITSRVSATETNLTTTTNKLNSLQVGGTNLLLSSGVSITNNSYGIQSYRLTEQFEVNKTYTISVCITPGTGVTYIQPYTNGGNKNLCTLYTSGTAKQVVTNSFVFNGYYNDSGKDHVTIYRFPNNGTTSNSTIHWIKLEKGNKATDWSPAPQDMETTVSNLTTRVSNAESKLTKDSLTTTIGSHYTTSTDVNNAITSKGYATTSQVQQTKNELTATFSESGGYNKIFDSYINTTSSTYGFATRSLDASKLVKGKTYTLSMNGRKTSASNTGYPVIFLYTSGWSWSTNVSVTSTTDTTQSVTFTLPTSVDVNALYVTCYHYPSGSTGSSHINWIQLTEGSVAQPWSPHPSEIYQGITRIDKDGIQVSQSNIATTTKMNANGFYIQKTDGTNIFKVDSSGLSFNGAGTFTGSVNTNSIIYANGGIYTKQDIKGTNLDGTGLSVYTDSGDVSIRANGSSNSVYLQPQSGEVKVTYPKQPSNYADIRVKSCIAHELLYSHGDIRGAKVYANGVALTSDRTLKEDIQYLSKDIIELSENDDNITSYDMYNFIRNDLQLAKYKYKGKDDIKIGFIAQDLQDTKIGEKILTTIKSIDTKETKLGYDIDIYVNVLAGALQTAIDKIEEQNKLITELSKKINNNEGLLK